MQLQIIDDIKNNRKLVSARELYYYLEIKSKYSDWINRMFEYGFVENDDYISVNEVTQKKEGSRLVNREQTNHQLTIDTAKEISMLQRNEKGKKIRSDLIELEKAWNSPEMIMKRALEFANNKIEELQTETVVQAQRIGELKPKSDYVDTILNSNTLVTITQIAQDYGMTANRLNKILKEESVQRKVNDQWVLYRQYIDKGYTQSETIYIKRSDGRPETKLNTKWTQKGRLFLHELLSDLGIHAVIEQY